MILIINTAKADRLEVILAKSRDDFKIKKLAGHYQPAQQLLPAISGMLNEADQSISDLKGLGVVSGPGGFTALRIGVVTANTLAYALKVPVVGLALEEFSGHQDLIDQVLIKLKDVRAGAIVLPAYGREPNITDSRKQ